MHLYLGMFCYPSRMTTDITSLLGQQLSLSTVEIAKSPTAEYFAREYHAGNSMWRPIKDPEGHAQEV